MAELSDAIEDLIEEAYLLGRSEEDIRADLEHFIDACEKVIREQVKNRERLEDLAEKLALARTCNLVSDLSERDPGRGIEEGQQKSSAERYAEKVARNKRSILKAIGDFDPKLLEKIERERFPGVGRELGRPRGKILPRKSLSERTQRLILRVSYGITLIFLLYLIYLVMFWRG